MFNRWHFRVFSGDDLAELTDLVRHAAGRTSYCCTSSLRLSCTLIGGNMRINLIIFTMSNQDISQAQDHSLGAEATSGSQSGALPPSGVSNAIKEALGSFKQYNWLFYCQSEWRHREEAFCRFHGELYGIALSCRQSLTLRRIQVYYVLCNIYMYCFTDYAIG